jgi:hypothetical protein
VFETLSEERLCTEMPIETNGNPKDRFYFTHLEAVGRSLAGMGPWLNLQDCEGEEKQQQERFVDLVCRGLDKATNPNSADHLNFTYEQQPMVDAAFLAQGLLRCWDSVWLNLDPSVQKNIVTCMRATRERKPHFNNWLLFSAMIEAFLHKAGSDWDRMRIDYAIQQHEQWYKGDGAYGDGPRFHWDYYNSFVIQPMLYDIVTLEGEISEQWKGFQESITNRLRRYAEVQERLIAPDGTFPPLGRSLAYRFGAFQALALTAWKSELPESIQPAAVRCALTTVMHRMMDRNDVFDENDWLRVGFCGHQPSLGETYISTGSLYLCLCGMLPLGLSADTPFWSDPATAWTSKRIWNGEDNSCDHGLHD